MSRNPHPDSEEALENAVIDLFGNTLEWETINAYSEDLGTAGTLGRETRDEVVLVRYLQSALQGLNPNVPTPLLQSAIEEITRSRSTLGLASANQEVYDLLKNGVKVKFKDDNDDEQVETLKVIDWNNPRNNHFLLISQFCISGEYGNKRADLIGFVNGIPLVFVELKAHYKRLENAYKKNLKDYYPIRWRRRRI